MSNDNPSGPPSRRRRIAGERKGARSADPVREPGSAATEEPAFVEAPVADGDPVDAPPDEVARDGRAVPLRVLAVLGVAALVMVAFAAQGFAVDGLGLGSWRTVQEQTEVETAQRTAPATAERAAAAILSYGYEQLEADRDNAAKFMTPSYREEYLDTFGLVLDNAPDLKAVVEADVRASGVSHADPDRVNVLLFVNQTTTSTANGGEPQTALNRVVLTMQRSGTGWLVDDITSY